ncbi:hypothetical protein C900_05612 [Fulvivirga imtechensis AK7]|uniref:Uncharacterized protein n=1 Tax=Fulvivirga imtechensis AK7 TaxID=1237149 RepID=L8JN16_9BACT|nr:hypothetical protein [Fulvivirga imtechensis]ELR68919.1 hypothetical protein C900_05612 [Fulvivirga imtechensis AK7]
MATETIKISKQSTGTGLYLEDNEGHAGDNTITTTVDPGDTVVWKLKDGGGIDEITNIYAKSTSQDIFSSDPVKQSDGSWKGTVSSSATGSESYSIDYKIGGTEYTDDPELKVNN